MKYAKLIKNKEIMTALANWRKKKIICEWFYDDIYNIYNTECGDAHVFFDGGVKENKHKFCPYCGRKIKEVNK